MEYTLISLNVRGLNSTGKRRLLYPEFKEAKADILFLQETHYNTKGMFSFMQNIYPTIFQATTENKRAGVAILMKKWVKFEPDEIDIELKNLEKCFTEYPSLNTLCKIIGIRSALKQDTIEEQTYYEKGNRADRGEITKIPEEILEVFEQFYKSLYSKIVKQQGKVERIEERIKEFIKDAKLPKLEPDQVQVLNREITVEEVKFTIKDLHRNKAPDGFTYSYYKEFKEILAPYMSRLFNSFMQGGVILRQVNYRICRCIR